MKDYIALLGSIKVDFPVSLWGGGLRSSLNFFPPVAQVTFSLRAKAFNTWQSWLNTLAKKREAETKLQAGGKPEKLAQVQQEIKEVRRWRT